ncbi:MAG: DoxX family protein [Gemmatimonas sp.]|nr:hypothetical protein [Gemmatimonadaceae bacterium]
MTTHAPSREKSSYTPDIVGASPPSDAVARWRPTTLLAFRFSFAYLGLFVFATQMLPEMFPIRGLDEHDLGTVPPMRNLVLWVGSRVLGIAHSIPHEQTGSGDRTYDWVLIFILLCIAATVTAVWTALARQRQSHERAFKWARVFIRLALATTMLNYGWAKAIPLQMPTLTLSRLVEPFGNFSPMGVLWSSIGAARAYEIFVGLAELGAGALLFWPRTATLGAAMCLMDTIAIFTLNMTYDVPVKLLSFHLVLMSLFLLAPNARQLFDLFVLHRSSTIREEPPLGRSARGRRNAVVAQIAYGGVMMLYCGYYAAHDWMERGGGAPRSPLFGIWDVQQMTVDGAIRPPLLTDSTRWRRFIFQSPTGARLQRPNDSIKSYLAAIDTNARTLTLTTADAAKTKLALSYQRPSHERLLIDGTMDGHAIHLELAFRDPESFLVRSRGFHWISEGPFNR